MDPRAELRGFAWVYLVDLCLAPVGFARGPGRRGAPGAARRACCRSPRCLPSSRASGAAGSTTRIALQRVAQDGRDRLQSIVQNSSDLIAIVDADGAIKSLTGSVAADLRRGLRRGAGRPLLDRVHPRRRCPVDAFLAGVAGKPTGRAARGRVAHALRGRRLPARLGGGDQPARRPARRRHRHHRPRRRGRARRSRSNCATAPSTTRSPGSPTARCSTTGSSTPSAGGDRAEDPGRRAVPRPRRLQDHQRRSRTRRGRPAAARGRARAWCRALRSADTAARLGGDEFGVLIEGVTDPEAVDRRPRERDPRGDRASRSSSPAGPSTVSASIGIAISDAAGPRRRGVPAQRATWPCTRPSATASGRAELYHAGLERRDGPGGTRGRGSPATTSSAPRSRTCSPTPHGSTIVFQPIMDLRTGQRGGLRVALAL